MHRHLLLASLLSAPALSQSVFVVDDDGGPGVDFTQLQPAIDAAGPLDRIEVRHGSYAAAVIDHAVTIMGEAPGAGRARVQGLVVMGLHGGETVGLVDLDVPDLTSQDSDGVVLVEGCFAGTVTLVRCADVRLQALRGVGFPDATRSIRAEDSLVQLSDSWIEPWIPFDEQDGDPAVVATRSTLVLTDSHVEGGEGGNQTLCWGPPVPNGGDALVLTASHVRACGSVLEGGGPGYDCFSSPSGLRGRAVRFQDAASSVLACATTVTHGVTGPGTLQTDDSLPRLSLGGAQAPGGTATFTFRAAPGSSTRAALGRFAATQAVPGLALPLFHSAERWVSLGSAPAGGQALPFVIPALPRGTMIHVQGSRTLGSGETALSNAVTLVVR